LILAAFLGSLQAGRAEGLYPPLELRWQFEAPGGFYAAPTVVDGKVYAGALDHCVYALDAATGEERWTFPMGDRLGSGLTVANGRVYAGSYDHRLYALEAATGRLRWQFTAAGIVDSIPLVANGMVYVKLPDDTVYALEAATGKERWRYVPEQPAGEPDKLSNWSPLALAGGRLLFGSNDAWG